MDSSLLLVAIFLPLVGAAVVFGAGMFGAGGKDLARKAALATAIATLLVVTWLARSFPSDAREFAVSRTPWAQGLGANVAFDVGLDGLGLWMFALSALLVVTSVLISWEAIDDRPSLFYGMLLLLEFGCLGVFAARDLLLFYVFFEFTLIPLFFLIGIWGSEERRRAAVKFFLYTLAGSVLAFLGLLSIVLWDFSRQSGAEKVLEFSIPKLTASLAAAPMEPGAQFVVFLALFAGFAIKVPLFPVHTWLPLAHVQAPAAGSVLLAGVLLKIGVYGFVRFSMSMLPDASVRCAPFILGLAVSGIVYGALVALAQRDMKRLIAYSSVSHLGYCMLGLFAFNTMGLHGGVLQMVNHGLSTGGLFAVVGMLYERYHTREISSFGGLAAKTPILAAFMVVFTFASIGVPGLNGFPGEFMALCGMFQRAVEGLPGLDGGWTMLLAVTAVAGVVLGAWYMLQLVQKVFFGPLREPHAPGAGHAPIADANPREIAALAMLVVFIVWIGLRPNDFLKPMTPTLADVQSTIDRSLDRAALATANSDDPQPPSGEGLARVR